MNTIINEKLKRLVAAGKMTREEKIVFVDGRWHDEEEEIDTMVVTIVTHTPVEEQE